MRYYIKSAKQAVLMLFKRGSAADYALVDEIEAYNLKVASDAFTAIKDGSADYAWTCQGARKMVFTRSTRGDFIQATHFALISGEWEPTSHTDVTDPKQFEERLFQGCYLNVA